MDADVLPVDGAPERAGAMGHHHWWVRRLPGAAGRGEAEPVGSPVRVAPGRGVYRVRPAHVARRPAFKSGAEAQPLREVGTVPAPGDGGERRRTTDTGGTLRGGRVDATRRTETRRAGGRARGTDATRLRRLQYPGGLAAGGHGADGRGPGGRRPGGGG